MSKQVQLRRGTAAQNDAFIGALAEVTVDTTGKTLRVHDGATPGGMPTLTYLKLVSELRSEGILSTNAFGVAKDGTDCTTALQAAVNDVIRDEGGELRFAPGEFRHSQIDISRPLGGRLTGENARVLPTGAATILYDVTGALYGTDTRRFEIAGLAVENDGFSNVSFYREATTYATSLKNLTLTNLAYAGVFNRGRGVQLDDIIQYGSGSWLFSGVGTGVLDRVFDITASNINQQSAGGSVWAGPWWEFYRCIGFLGTNVISASLDGATIGARITGACEGVEFTQGLMVYPTTGFKIEVGADGVQPAYIYLTHCSADQPTVTGFDIDGFVVKGRMLNSTFGFDRTNSGYGMILRSAAYDVDLSAVRVSNMYGDGLHVESGVTDVNIKGLTSRNNNLGSVGGVDLRIAGSNDRQVRISDANIGTSAVTGQIVEGGNTSPMHYRGLGQAGTPASTTTVELGGTTIGGGVLVGQEALVIRASGRFGSNGNTKSLNFSVAGSSLALISGTFNGEAWTLDAEITRIDATNVWINAVLQCDTQRKIYSGLVAIATASNFTVTVNGQNGAAVANDIVRHIFTVQRKSG